MKKLAKNKMSSATLELCRYTPKIEIILDELVENYKNGKPLVNIHSCELFSLSVNEKIGAGGVIGGAGPRSLKNKKLGMKIAGYEDENSLVTCPKVIVFGLGGIGYNEIRCIMDIANNHVEDLVFTIGGTSILKPNDYIQNIKGMNSLF